MSLVSYGDLTPRVASVDTWLSLTYNCEFVSRTLGNQSWSILTRLWMHFNNSSVSNAGKSRWALESLKLSKLSLTLNACGS
jgi:hypothetical protein